LGGPTIRAHPTTRGFRPVAAAGLAASAVVLLLAAADPAGAAVSEARRYQVRRGETLSGIAASFGVEASDIAGANDLVDPDVVYAGDWLDIPSSSSGAAPARDHRVADGETLSDIADQYGLATSTLAEANGIDDPDLVVIGTVLSIPAVGPDGDGASSSLPKRLRQSPDRLALMGAFDIWAARYDVPPDLLKATTWLESGWQNDVVSSTGAVGIGQLMPITVDTVNELMGTNLSPWVPDQNIRMSARNLRFLLDLTGGDTARALAGYYQGLGSVERDGLYPSTLAYINGVLELRARFG
jgi:soluble lytic murein transglycosylase-like protein